MTLSVIGTHFVTYIYYYCAQLSLSLPEAVHNLLSRFLRIYTVSLRVQRLYFLFNRLRRLFVAGVISYHTWSSNGRWIVFASRRDDHNYSRVFIAYFDREGQAHRAFMLPQRDPQYNTLMLKSYNVPELTKRAVQVSHETLRHVIYHTEADNARYE